MDNMSASGIQTKLEEISQQVVVWIVNARVGRVSRAGINREPRIKFKELMRRKPLDDHHPIVRQVFNWLSSHKCSPEVFIEVAYLLEINCKRDVGCRLYLRYLAKVMTEALAIQCPVLEGTWIKAVYAVLEFCALYGAHNQQFASEHFTWFVSERLNAWIIHIIGDPDLCPNLILRTNLMQLFVNIAIINDRNRALALRSVMLAFSFLNTKNDDEKEWMICMNLDLITQTLRMFRKNGYLLELDHRLSENLKAVKASRLSEILHDVSCAWMMSPIRYTEPVELQALIGLLNVIARSAQVGYKTFQKEIFIFDDDILEETSSALKMVINNFIKSLQMHQLINITASCIMDVLELVLLVYASQPVDQENKYLDSLCHCDTFLERICQEGLYSIPYSPVGKKIICKYPWRLHGIRSKLGNFNGSFFSSINSLVYYECLDV